MFPRYRTEGFIFKERNLREADRIYSVYTRDFGRVEILGKGIRKISSKLRGHMVLFSIAEIEFIQGKAYKTLVDTLSLKKFKRIRKSEERLEIAYNISVLIDKFIKGEEKEEEIWKLILEVFEKLNSYFLTPSLREILYHYFLWNFLSLLGYNLQLDHCVLCQKKPNSSPFYFDFEEGGLICNKCHLKYKKGKKINEDLIKLFKIILSRDLKLLGKIRISQEHLKRAEKFSREYIKFIGG